MKKPLIVIAMLLAVFVCVEVADAEAYSTISGHVTEEGTGKPIAGQAVTAVKMDSVEPYVINGVTDENGLYVLQGAIGGTYNVSLERLAGYYPDKRTIEVTVIGGENIVNNNYILKKAGSVSGRIFKGDGTTPYVGVTVIADVPEGGYQFSARTDESGFYKIGGLPDTEYAVVGAIAPGVGAKYTEGIKIVGGEETKNVNIAVVKDASSLSIKGKVLLQGTNEGLENIAILILGKESLAKVATDASGNFEVYGLPLGTYSVMIAQFGYEFFSKEGIELKEGETPLEIEFILSPGSGG